GNIGRSGTHGLEWICHGRNLRLGAWTRPETQTSCALLYADCRLHRYWDAYQFHEAESDHGFGLECGVKWISCATAVGSYHDDFQQSFNHGEPRERPLGEHSRLGCNHCHVRCCHGSCLRLDLQDGMIGSSAQPGINRAPKSLWPSKLFEMKCHRACK